MTSSLVNKLIESGITKRINTRACGNAFALPGMAMSIESLRSQAAFSRKVLALQSEGKFDADMKAILREELMQTSGGPEALDDIGAYLQSEPDGTLQDYSAGSFLDMNDEQIAGLVIEKMANAYSRVMIAQRIAVLFELMEKFHQLLDGCGPEFKESISYNREVTIAEVEGIERLYQDICKIIDGEQ